MEWKKKKIVDRDLIEQLKDEHPLLENCTFTEIYRIDNICTGEKSFQKDDENNVSKNIRKSCCINDNTYSETCNYILKIQQIYNENEITFQLLAATLGIAPAIHEIWTCLDKSTKKPVTAVFVMDELQDTLENYLKSSDSDENKLDKMKKVIEAIKILHKHGIRHNDLHTRNIMINRDGSVFIIDYEKATKFSDYATRMLNDYQFIYRDIEGLAIDPRLKEQLLYLLKDHIDAFMDDEEDELFLE